MAILDRFYIKVNEDNVYSSSGVFKNLRELNTHGSVLYPTHFLESYVHPVLSAIEENPNTLRSIDSTETTKFFNESEGIDFLFDRLDDAKTPLVSGRLFKGGVEFPLMNPYMVELLDSFSATSSRVILADGTYELNRYGSVDGTLRNAGILEIQGAGGGSGGTNNVNSDSAGGGGAAGGYSAIYYRIKNTKASSVFVEVKTGSGGTAGGSNGTTNGGGGGQSYVQFTTPSEKYVLISKGGGGGITGNYNYTDGGAGGSVVFETRTLDDVVISSTTIAGGGREGDDNNKPLSGAVSGEMNLLDNEYLFIHLLAAQGGAGGGRGDDTDGTPQGQAGAGSTQMTYSIPKTYFCADNLITLQAHSGGARGADVTDATAGGGGASVFANGGAGGAKSTNGNAGSLGSGAGGAGAGGNSNRAGSKGGDGVIYYFVN